MVASRGTPAGFADAASGQPLNPGAREALLAAFDAGWADPARLYREARQARMLLDAARESIAATLGLRPPEVSFTGSGIQARHLAVLGALAAGAGGGPRRVIASAVEHSAILRAADHAAGDTATVLPATVLPATVLPVNSHGRVDPDALRPAISAGNAPPAALVAVQWANHEVGTVQPVADLHTICREAGVALLVDAAQGLGRLPWSGAADIVVADAHVWGGPAGLGILGVRSTTRWAPPGPVDDREGGRVPGFTAVPLAVAAARGLEWAEQNRAAEADRAERLIRTLRDAIVATIPDIDVLGDPIHRLPHLLAVSFLYVSGDEIVSGMDRQGFAVTSGSSCVADTRRPSHVLAAMGALTQGNVRISLPFDFDEVRLGDLATSLARVVGAVRADLGAPT